MTKKLVSPTKGTAIWLTSVGNELGQVLIRVLTAQEGARLDLMADGLIKRYQQAGVDPPAVLYIDCGSCIEAGPDETRLKARSSGWPDFIVRLDICHFMRRIAIGCATDAHQLYPTFMSRLPVTSQRQRLTKEELALHCRRRTHGEETTVPLLEQLLQ